MGGCVGSPAGGRRGSASPSALSDSSLFPTTKNKPLKGERIRWKSDVPLTEAQLRSKREEFWDTAPAFEGKTEIWAALKAAVDAAAREDQALAQAILDGAGISLPGGSLVECYDELGTRYSIPVYCLSLPVNLVVEGAGDRDSPAEFSEPVELEEGVELKVRVRVSLTGEDVRLVINSRDTVAQAKRKLHEQEGVGEPATQRWYFGGKLLGDKQTLGDTGVPSGYVIQCIINVVQFDVIQA